MQRKIFVMFLCTVVTTMAFGASETVLFNFKGGKDAGGPRSGLVMDKAGNLYGVTSQGGRGGTNCFGEGCGFVYKLSPTSGGTWKKTNLYEFTGGSDGGVPVGNLAIDAKGNLYGVTEQGGTGGCDTVLGGGCGVVFRVSPKSNGKWKYSVIHDFDPGRIENDGSYADAGLIIDESGNLYGTTTFGGGFVCDCGIVYQLKPTQGGQWTEHILYVFVGISQGGSDVSFPDSDVFVDKRGHVFGTGSGGGDVLCNDGCGGVYELIPQSNGSYTEKVLKIFHGGKDGMQPDGGVIVDSKGNVYGTTDFGGGGTGCTNGGFGCGTVFELQKSAKGYRQRILHRFNGPDGYAPFADLYLDGQGSLYGTTQAGGDSNNGTVFQVTESSGKWKQSVLHSFSGGQDGDLPQAGLIPDTKGGLFGTTRGGGTGGRGTVYHIVP
jgi:uncharacterized repeat protein (TIGR03803 family)